MSWTAPNRSDGSYVSRNINVSFIVTSFFMLPIGADLQISEKSSEKTDGEDSMMCIGLIVPVLKAIVRRL